MEKDVGVGGYFHVSKCKAIILVDAEDVEVEEREGKEQEGEGEEEREEGNSKGEEMVGEDGE